MGLDLGEFQLAGELPPFEGAAYICAPRRTVLDKLLLDAAAEAGAEVREGFAVTGLTEEDGRITGIRARGRDGQEIREPARLVIGADGYNSLVARAVGAAEYNVRPVLTCAHYGYWAGVAQHMPAIHPRPRRMIASFPTNDGLTIVVVIAPRDEFPAIRTDPERHLQDALSLVDDFREPFRQSVRVEPIRGTAAIPNFFRKPFGNGWVLVGDAGYHKDPILAQGISDAFRSAQWVTDAIHAGFSGARPLDHALAAYQRARDEHFAPMYQMCIDLAGLAPPPPEMLALYQALRSDGVERDRFFGTLGGTVPIPEYYAPENLQRIVSSATVV
jgi:flavin-dependent dehydrogenase